MAEETEMIYLVFPDGRGEHVPRGSIVREDLPEGSRVYTSEINARLYPELDLLTLDGGELS